MVRLMSAVLCVLMLWSGAGRADPSATPYLLSPGDRVMISVWQEDTLRQETTVLPDGSITFPWPGASMWPGSTRPLPLKRSAPG
jgi:polysaccharide export outer membrane protein